MDIIVSLKYEDGRIVELESVSQLTEEIALYHDTCVYTVNRDGKLLDITATPEKQEDGTYILGVSIDTNYRKNEDERHAKDKSCGQSPKELHIKYLQFLHIRFYARSTHIFRYLELCISVFLCPVAPVFPRHTWRRQRVGTHHIPH